MICKNCGTELGTHQDFCPKCGKRVKMLMQGRLNDTAMEFHKKRHIYLSPAVVIAIVSVVVVSLILYNNSKPRLYESAVASFEKGAYARAEKKFSRIVGYKDSEVLLAECQYKRAWECVDEGNYDLALELIRAYEASSVTDESLDDIKNEIASGCISQEKYEEAANLYQELGMVWEEAEACAGMGNYARAIELTKTYECSDTEQKKIKMSWYCAQVGICTTEQKYDEAWEYLKEYYKDYYVDDELGQYACQIARFFMDNGKFAEAVEVAEPLKNNMEEARALLNECYEAWGISCANEENYETAWECFSKCEVSEAGRPSLYTTGLYYMEKGIYSEAYHIWHALEGYQDSAEQLVACCREQGAVLEQAGEYESALEMYEEIGDEDLATRCTYNWAGALEEAGEYESALEMYEEIGDEDLATRCMYNWAEHEYRHRYYDSAAQKYTDLGDYEDSMERASEAQWRMRQQTLAGGWKTDDGYMRIHIDSPSHNPNSISGGSIGLEFDMAMKEAYTVYNGDYSDRLRCGIKTSVFQGSDSSAPSGQDRFSWSYSEDLWDYKDEYLFIRAEGGGWNIFPCTLKGNTMTLTIDRETFKLTKE